MKELTMKEKIDKVLDKRDEADNLANEFAKFLVASPSSHLASFQTLEEVDKVAKELGQVPTLKKWNDARNTSEYGFKYRNVSFYALIED